MAQRASGSPAVSVRMAPRQSGRAPRGGEQVGIAAEFVDADRPRRVRSGSFAVDDDARIEVCALGPAVAMPGLGYGGYNDGRGLGAWRGIEHDEADVWDVSHCGEVGYPDGSRGRPADRIQPVTLTQYGPDGTSHGTA